MGAKRIRLSEDVYAKIEARKRPDESFSQAIDRLTDDWSLAEWAGWTSDEEAARHLTGSTNCRRSIAGRRRNWSSN